MQRRTDKAGRTDKAARALRWSWTAALACFVLAGLTGVFYRFGIAYGWTAGLELGNVRHAHSHLMYFGWVTPVLMALISRHLPAVSGRTVGAGVRWVIGGAFVAGLMSYPLFLAFGYTPVELGARRLPLAVIASSLNMFAWYAFVAYYARATWGAPRNRALLLWDVALTFLVLATCGGWGLALLKPLGLHDPVLASGLTHVFLDLFSEGWFVLGMLGVLHAVVGAEGRRPWHWSLLVICLGLPVTFALGMPALLVPSGLQQLARAGGVLVAVGLLAQVRLLWPARPGVPAWVWRIPLGLLAVKALAELSVGVVPGAWWASEPGLRILYLHVMLLGFVSLALFTAARITWGAAATRGLAGVYGCILLMLASLVPLTSLWPAVWWGPWVFDVAAWAALTAVLAVAAVLVRARPVQYLAGAAGVPA